MSGLDRALVPKESFALLFILKIYNNNEFAIVIGDSRFGCEKKLGFFRSAWKDRSNIKQENGMDEVKYYSNSFVEVMDPS